METGDAHAAGGSVPAARWDGPVRAAAAAALLLPLVVVPSAFLFPYVATKVHALRSLAWILGAVTIGGLLVGRLRPFRPGAVTWAGAALLGCAVAATAAGVDPSRSLWDSGERMLGLVTAAAVATWYVVVRTVCRSPREFVPLLRTSLGVGIAVAVLACVEGVRGTGPDGGDRAAATLGSPAYLGACGLHVVFAGALLAACGPCRADRWLASAAVAAGVAAVAVSSARASLVGLAIGAFWLAGFALVRGTRRARVAAVLGLLAAAAAGAVVLLASDSPVVRTIPLARRLADPGTGHDTLSTRLLAWEAALDAARERPVLGWGPNAFVHAFSAHHRPEILRHGHAETFFDDAHGIVPNTLAEQGLAGLAALAAFAAAVSVALRRARAAGTLPASAAVCAGAWFVAHGGSLLFSFEDPSSVVHVALLAALCDAASVAPEDGAPRAVRPTRLRWAAAIVVAAASLVWTYVAEVRPAAASAEARAAVAGVRSDPGRAVESFEAAQRSRWPHARTAAHAFGGEAVAAVPALRAAGRHADADRLSRAAFDALGPVEGPAPPDVVAALLRASLVERCTALASDSSAAADAEADLRRVLGLAPRRLDVAYALAALEMRRGRPDLAEARMEDAVRDAPGVGSSWVRLAAVRAQTGRVAEARRLVGEARARGVTFLPQDEALLRSLGE